MTHSPQVLYSDDGRLTSFLFLADITECSFYPDENCGPHLGMTMSQPNGDLSIYNMFIQSFWCKIIAQ